MPEQKEIDLRAAINAISDVVENRPRSLREFDQIYMKAGDMVLQSGAGRPVGRRKTSCLYRRRGRYQHMRGLPSKAGDY